MFKHGDWVEAVMFTAKDGTLMWGRAYYLKAKGNQHVVSFDADSPDRVVSAVRVPSDNG